MRGVLQGGKCAAAWRSNQSSGTGVSPVSFRFVERNLRVAGTARAHRVGWEPLSQIRKLFTEGKLFLPVQDTSGASAHCPRSAGFQTCRIADFQIGDTPKL
jgi:hypothetical protein